MVFEGKDTTFLQTATKKCGVYTKSATKKCCIYTKSATKKCGFG
jgi:hypothetical protein